MKKLFLALLAVFSIALVVAGCGGDSKPAANRNWLKKALICRSLNSAIMLNPICLWLIKN